MEVIERLLEKDEKILWKKSKIRNLMKIYQVIIAITIVSSFFIFILYPCIAIVAFTYNIDFISFLIFFLISEISILLGISWIFIKDRIKMIRILQKTIDELKSYEEIDIITNKRIIQKNYIWADTLKKNLPEFAASSVKIKTDLIFLNIDAIEVIIVDLKNKEIGFMINEIKDNYIIYFDFFKRRGFDPNEMFYALKILKEILPLRKVKENEYEIEYRVNIYDK